MMSSLLVDHSTGGADSHSELRTHPLPFFHLTVSYSLWLISQSCYYFGNLLMPLSQMPSKAVFVSNKSTEAPPLVPSRNPNIGLDEGCWLCQNNLQDFDYRDVLVLEQFIRLTVFCYFHQFYTWS